MKESDYSYELIAKELTSDSGTNESEELKKILASDKKLEKKFRNTEKFWLNYFPAKKSHNIIEKTEKKLDFTYQSESRFNSSLFYKIAAIFFFILSVGLGSWFYHHPENEMTLKEYTCGPGETKKVVLSDGTEVWLNNMSVLMSVEPFESDSRSVKLIGEAFFNVAHNAKKPFIVEAFGLKTEVLGTSFNLNAYPRLKHKEIALYEGSVKISTVENPGKTLLMKPGEKIRVSVNNSEFYISEIDVNKPAVWREGILEFKNEEFFEIARKLERKFDTRIFIGSKKTGELKYTAEFENESLEKILKLLNEAKDFDYSFTDEGVIISSVK